MLKNQLLFLIEDEDGELFVFYLDTPIQRKYDEQIFTTNNKSFHFNLQSNGRLSKPMKFEIKNKNLTGYQLTSSYSDILIQIGDIVLNRKSKRDFSYCKQTEEAFLYENIENAICGKTKQQNEIDESNKYFTLKRLLVIQMTLSDYDKEYKEIKEMNLIKEIEKLTDLEYVECLFDSDIHNCC